MRLTDFTVRIYESYGNDLLFNDRYIDQARAIMHIEDVDKSGQNLTMEITLNTKSGNSMPHMLAEVEVYGKPLVSAPTSFDILVGNLFLGIGDEIKYISFVQDNDLEPLIGESNENINTLLYIFIF